MAKSGEAKKRLLQESWRRRNSAAMALILEFLSLSYVRSVTSVRDAAVFFKYVSKDPGPKIHKSSSDFAGRGSQPRKTDFARCSGIFRLWDESLTSQDSLEAAISGKHGFTPDNTPRIGFDFARECQGSCDLFLRIKQLIEAHYEGAAIGIHLDIGNCPVAIPTEANKKLVLYS
jgi:hypothetical protein